MTERTDKINGSSGFGYSGELGDVGNKGGNILFSEICYGDYSVPEVGYSHIPFFSDDNIYIKVPERLTAKAGDVVIVTGNIGTKIHVLVESEETELRVKDESEYDIDIDVLPNWQYSAIVYTQKVDGKDYIYLRHSMSIENIENAEIYGIINGEKVIFKNYGETEFTEKTDIVSLEGVTADIMIFMNYKITPYKIIKSFLYETTY